MKQLFTILGIILFILVGCKETTQPKAIQNTISSQSFDTFLEQYNETKLQLFPLSSTDLGETRYNHLLENPLSKQYRNNINDFYKSTLSQLLQFNQSTLNENQLSSFEILKWECEINVEQGKFKKVLWPINQFESFHLRVGQLASGASSQPFETPKDYENWLQRMTAVSEWCDSLISYLKVGIDEGYTLPKWLTIKMIPQFDALANNNLEEHLFFTPILNFPDSFDDSTKKDLNNKYSKFLEEELIPKFERITTFLKSTYLPKCRETSGISQIPFGKEYYNLQIKKFTTTNMTSDEIYDLGLKEVARIRSEMEKVKNQVGFEGSLAEFFDFVRNNPELKPYTEPQQVINNFISIHEKMKPQLANLFDLVPKTQFEVRRTESFREASSSAEYNQGSKDGTRPGIFYVPIPDVENYNVFSDESLFLHEAIPGHHYQFSLQQENENLPEFRRSLWYSSYGEGWALYCESLGKELGLYNDPYQYFGNLSMEIHRAIRLVVDVGIHLKGWTREEAIQYSLENEAETEASIIAEIERYMSWPGQALSYKIGQLKIRELRAKAENELGEKFSIQEFHNKILEGGCMPLAILEKKINEWIDSSK